uniref:Uncharacterized protein n=1 Tax=Oryza rufipogon TaxID=4529 RepID=A0A0E0MU30_ORYRU
MGPKGAPPPYISLGRATLGQGGLCREEKVELWKVSEHMTEVELLTTFQDAAIVNETSRI